MGEIRTPAKVKIIVGILAKDAESVEAVRGVLKSRFGEEDLNLEPFPFTFTNYYKEEIGEAPVRAFFSYENLVDRETIVDIKRKEDTNDKGKTKYSYRPVLELNVGTQTYKKAAGVKSENRKAYKVGDKVNIKFNPLKPKEFMTTKQKTGVVTGGLVIAASAVLAGVTLWLAK